MSDEGDFEDFLEDYKFTYAENYLKKNPMDEEKIKIAIKILERKMLPLKEKIAAIVKIHIC